MANRSFERSSCISKYLQEISEFPLLTKEEEHEIAVRMQDNAGKSGSYHDLVKSNLSFVVKIASEYRNMGLPFEDLLNEGNIGLIEAAHHFDHTRGTKFITYAIWWIRKSILKALSQHSAMVRIPNYQLKKVRLALRSLSDQEQTVIINRFGLEGGRVFTLKEIGEKLGVSRERVRQIENQAKRRLRKLIARQQRNEPSDRDNGRTRVLPATRLQGARVKPGGTMSH
jgi:RNA polymerase primary sigma factor